MRKRTFKESLLQVVNWIVWNVGLAVLLVLWFVLDVEWAKNLAQYLIYFGVFGSVVLVILSLLVMVGYKGDKQEFIKQARDSSSLQPRVIPVGLTYTVQLGIMLALASQGWFLLAALNFWKMFNVTFSNGIYDTIRKELKDEGTLQ